MTFRTASIALFLASASLVSARDSCYNNYDEVLADTEIASNKCSYRTIFKIVRNKYIANQEEAPMRCRGGVRNEMMGLTGTETEDDAIAFITDMCHNALKASADEVGSGDFARVEGTGVDLDDFFNGDTHLNLETGNFKNNLNAFEKRGSNVFNYIGTDPQLNDHYPTTAASYQSGQAIKDMYNDEAESTWFTAPTSNFGNGCASNTAMCCWHRDRQYFDGNGNCRFQDCANQQPGDNTDLCWTKSGEEVFPYPGDGTEGAIHCHGFAWSNDFADDYNAMARWNNLFYVSMYDHLYQRGYAESITHDPNLQGEQPMCGCVEEMNPVARADCTEAVGSTTYQTSLSASPTETNADQMRLSIDHVSGSFTIDFQACQGIKYVDDYGPEDYQAELAAGTTENIVTTSNDLAAFVFKNYLTEKMDIGHVDAVRETIVGFNNPNIQNDDDAREQACADAFAEKYPDLVYEEKAVEAVVA